MNNINQGGYFSLPFLLLFYPYKPIYMYDNKIECNMANNKLLKWSDIYNIKAGAFNSTLKSSIKVPNKTTIENNLNSGYKITWPNSVASRQLIREINSPVLTQLAGDAKLTVRYVLNGGAEVLLYYSIEGVSSTDFNASDFYVSLWTEWECDAYTPDGDYEEGGSGFQNDYKFTKESGRAYIYPSYDGYEVDVVQLLNDYDLTTSGTAANYKWTIDIDEINTSSAHNVYLDIYPSYDDNKSNIMYYDGGATMAENASYTICSDYSCLYSTEVANVQYKEVGVDYDSVSKCTLILSNGIALNDTEMYYDIENDEVIYFYFNKKKTPIYLELESFDLQNGVGWVEASVNTDKSREYRFPCDVTFTYYTEHTILGRQGPFTHTIEKGRSGGQFTDNWSDYQSGVNNYFNFTDMTISPTSYNNKFLFYIQQKA